MISNLNSCKNIDSCQIVKKSSQLKCPGINNTGSDWAVKRLSLISVNSEHVLKICSVVNLSSNLMHIGGSSPFNKKEWVIKEWPMYNRAITVSSFLLWTCKSEDKQYILLILGISYIIYFLGTHPTQTATVLTYIFICAWF